MKKLFICLTLLFVFSCAEDRQATTEQGAQADSRNGKVVSTKQPEKIKEIEWDDLIPEEYSPQAVVTKYQDEIESLEDNTAEAEAIYQKIMDEMASAPMNQKMAEKNIRLPGFIAPLVHDKGKITEFLLVPYFGACIHVPAPPPNQTVFVKTEKDQGIAISDAYLPVMVSGKISLDKNSTDIGEAGYSILNANVKIFNEESEVE